MPEKNFQFSKKILGWYDQKGRKHLPWREQISPYRVWVSEIMLQQTQVKTVIAYFQRFITRFPTLEYLAAAAEDEVFHLWTGLGYYARARYLHRAAKYIIKQYNGQFPNTLETLQALPGIGRSTAGAILAIAFNQHAAILDGNVKRVLTRFHAIPGFSTQTDVLNKLWHIAEQHTPEKRVADYTQAMMDLGATICTRSKPQCTLCPVHTNCQAYLQNRQMEFPMIKTKKKIPVRTTNLLLFYDPSHHQVLLEKRPPSGIWGGLWSFPECNEDANIVKWCADILNIEVLGMQTLATFKHIFTHFQLNITPVYMNDYRLQSSFELMDADRYVWHKLDGSTPRGFSAPVQRLLNYFK